MPSAEKIAFSRDVKATSSSDKIPLAYPSRKAPPKGETLLDTITKRKEALSQIQSDQEDGPEIHMNESGVLNILGAGLIGPDDSPIGPLGEAIFYSISLTMLHFTFDTLVYNQYRQSILWGAIIQRTATAFPILFLLVYILHTPAMGRIAVLKQTFFCAVAVVTGCYTIHVTKKYDYFMVMKQTPPLGTLWIWSVVELELKWALLTVGVDILWIIWKGYSVF